MKLRREEPTKSLKPLKETLKLLEEAEGKVQVRHTKRRMEREFKKVHQVLEEEEADTITVTEEELRAEDVSFLQNYKAAVERVQQRPPPHWRNQSRSPELC